MNNCTKRTSHRGCRKVFQFSCTLEDANPTIGEGRAFKTMRDPKENEMSQSCTKLEQGARCGPSSSSVMQNSEHLLYYQSSEAVPDQHQRTILCQLILSRVQYSRHEVRC